jgi:hypothetical protein
MPESNRYRKTLLASDAPHEIFVPLGDGEEWRLRTFRRWPLRRAWIAGYMRFSATVRSVRAWVESHGGEW